MKRKKLLTAAICLCLISVLVISSAAFVKYKFTSSSGEAVIKTVNRVDISVSATSFEFDKVGKDGLLVCTAKVSIGKTEPDFYGVLDSITLSGEKTEYALFTAGKNNPTDGLPQSVTFPVSDGKAYPIEWEITFAVPYEEGRNEYNMFINFDYTTGIKETAAQRYQTSIPVNITVG